ncbi:MAG TPA: TadE family protein [Candidatus Acidoferrales bacterium]|jgi:hypothetical protein|nr:TadE family protein [Candidatus Acidoferrales bacterium]
MESPVTRGARGQALIETAIFLPLALLTLFAVIWAAQYGLASERVQSAIRYSGLVGNQINPYTENSMYVLYNSLGATSTNSPIPMQTCNPPNADALSNNNVSSSAAPGGYPGPVNGPFWQASPAPPTMTCANAQTQTAAFSAGMNQTALALSNRPQISTGTIVPTYLQSILGTTSTTTASLNFMKPAGMAVILSCHPQLQTAIAASLAPTPPPSSPTVPAALAEPIPAQPVIPVTC